MTITILGIYLLGFLVHTAPCFSTELKPVVTVYTPDSILNRREQFKPLYAGERQRYSTCTGVTWFHDHYLAALNLHGHKITLYEFNEKESACTLIQEITNKEGAALLYPENMAVSPDGTLLALANGNGLQLYALDGATHCVRPAPLLTLPFRDIVHNVRFTRDGKYLLCASFDSAASLSVYRVPRADSAVDLKLVYREAGSGPLKAKAINVTHDGRYVVTAYAYMLQPFKNKRFESLLVIREFDHATGCIGRTISETRGKFAIEDIAIIDNDRAIVASDQAHDCLLWYPFDPLTGQIDGNHVTMEGAESQLHFPHGLGVSIDQKYLAVATYGNDACSIYALQEVGIV